MRLERPTSLVKVFASEQSISIAGLIGIFTRVSKTRRASCACPTR
jgi:hypothetical protein